MANTSNIGLSKLDGTEKLKTFPTTFNGDMDTIDTVVGNDVGTSRTISQAITRTEEGIAIVANGNTHSAISSGQYVYVKNHGSLAEGLYTASSNISANATLSGSNLTAVSGGGLNSVYSALNGKLPTQQTYSADIGLDMDEVKDLGALTELVPSNGKSYGAITCYSSSNGNCLVMMRNISGSLHLIAKNLASFHIDTTAYMRVLLI